MQQDRIGCCQQTHGGVWNLGGSLLGGGQGCHVEGFSIYCRNGTRIWNNVSEQCTIHYFIHIVEASSGAG